MTDGQLFARHLLRRFWRGLRQEAVCFGIALGCALIANVALAVVWVVCAGLIWLVFGWVDWVPIAGFFLGVAILALAAFADWLRTTWAEWKEERQWS